VFPRAKRDGGNGGGGGGDGGGGGGAGGGAGGRRRRTRDSGEGRERGARPERGSKRPRPPDRGINRRWHEETPRDAHDRCYCFIINEAETVALPSRNASAMSAQFERSPSLVSSSGSDLSSPPRGTRRRDKTLKRAS